MGILEKPSILKKLSDIDTSLGDMANKKTYINIKDYGAKGDGTTDDTVAFNNCFANSLNRNIYIPSGTYIVEYTHFEKGLRLLGDGYDKTIIKRKNGYNCDTFDQSQPKKGNLLGNTMYDYSTKESVSIDGICFDGNVQNIILTEGSNLRNMFNNVQLYYLDNLFINNCKFINSISDGLFLGGIGNTVIESSYFEHTGFNNGGDPRSRNSMSVFGTYYNTLISQTLLAENNTTIKNCFFKDSADMGVVSRNIKNLNVENCEFSSIANSSMELYGDASSSSTLNNTFHTKFTIKNNVFLSGNVTHGDPNKTYKEIFIFENNLMKGQRAFSISGNSTDFEVFVKNNSFEVSQIFFSNLNNVTLEHNNIKAYHTTTGVFFGECAYPIVIGNYIYGGINEAVENVLQFYNITTEPVIANNQIIANILSTHGIYMNYIDSVTLRCENIRILGNEIINVNRGVNISFLVNNSILINSNIFDVPVAGDYCVTQWSGNCKKAVSIGNICINNTTISINAVTKNISNNV